MNEDDKWALPEEFERSLTEDQLLPASDDEGPEPCGYCGAREGFDTSYAGWPHCVVCHGC